ncbi:MAG: hypothetical protein U0W40_03020 [Acidimicrobiia bacterium]
MTPITEILPDDLRARADDVVHKVRDDVEARLPGRARDRRRRQASRAPRRWVAGVVGLVLLGVLVWCVARVVRGGDRRPAVTHLGPEAGTPSDVPGPAFDPDASPMRAEAGAAAES